MTDSSARPVAGPARSPSRRVVATVGLGFALFGAVTIAVAQTPCTPIATGQPEATDQRPSFPGQTRACAVDARVTYEVAVFATGLERPWAVEPLPGGGLLVTEKAGRLRAIAADGTVGPPIAGLPTVDAGGQGGLLDVALSPSFARDRTIFWSYAEPRDGGNATSVARGRLGDDLKALDDVRVVFRSRPAYDGDKHFGSRLAFGPDGMLYLTLGDRSDRPMRPQAQRLDSHLGKVLRFAPDGSVPADNPFVGRAGALPEIWATGFRNVQAAAFDARGALWVVEMGTRGGDELNRVERGKNYGWPLQAFGIEYSGQPIAGSATRRDGMEPPVYYWDPVIAPSGAQFYDGAAFPAWRGSLFTGGLKVRSLVRLTFDAQGRVAGEERLLTDRGQRIRDVRQGLDGELWVVTDARDGEVWRISPKR